MKNMKEIVTNSVNKMINILTNTNAFSSMRKFDVNLLPIWLLKDTNIYISSYREEHTMSEDKSNPLSSKLIYSIPCSYSVVYIGKSGRSLNNRLAEDQSRLRSVISAKSAFAEQRLATGHRILFDSTSVVTVV